MKLDDSESFLICNRDSIRKETNFSRSGRDVRKSRRTEELVNREAICSELRNSCVSFQCRNFKPQMYTIRKMQDPFHTDNIADIRAMSRRSGISCVFIYLLIITVINKREIELYI